MKNQILKVIIVSRVVSSLLKGSGGSAEVFTSQY